MQLLADESCDYAIIRALRAAGHDVVAVSETCAGADDRIVLEAANRERRVLLTEDKDFGNLVFASGYPTGGVILLRYPVQGRANVLQAVVDLVRDRASDLPGSFVVVEPGRIRIARAIAKPCSSNPGNPVRLSRPSRTVFVSRDTNTIRPVTASRAAPIR